MYQNNSEHYEFMNSNLVIEEIAVEIENYKEVVQIADENKIKVALVDNQKLKQEFLLADNFLQFTQVLIISSISQNCDYDDPFFHYILMITKVIRKALKRMLVPNSIKTKQEFIIKENQLFRCFYQDINIGFITSTGQIKSTAFIYIHKNIRDLIIKKIVIDQKQERVRFLMHFFRIENIIKIPYVQLDYKHQFIKTNKFKNEFLILNEESENHQTLFHVYKPMDDQIYFIKRIHLPATLTSSFMNVFHAKDVYISRAKILASLSHPNIIRLYDWWLEILNYQTYLFMQIEYCTYPRYISQAKNLLSYAYFYMNPMSCKQKHKLIQDIMLQIMQGLEFLKQRNIHVIDLKPENIMVTITVTGDLQVLITDFNPNQNKKQTITNRENISPAFGALIMHLILTFPGDGTLRNNYINKFQNMSLQDSISLFDSWAQKVKNRNRDFSFYLFKNLMQSALSLLINQQQYHDFNELKTIIQKIV
ncbi:unnamed protein product [Paramecium sonneborni]|uniref:Protein kinase domain-containing protein n=1 Tax=Paramecium sonneborni TaxID=65129 RepID=A0A8S1KNM5_9CILI|nr:unnamed protein product [Paramecium sonneborni]